MARYSLFQMEKLPYSHATVVLLKQEIPTCSALMECGALHHLNVNLLNQNSSDKCVYDKLGFCLVLHTQIAVQIQAATYNYYVAASLTQLPIAANSNLFLLIGYLYHFTQLATYVANVCKIKLHATFNTAIYIHSYVRSYVYVLLYHNLYSYY